MNLAIAYPFCGWDPCLTWNLENILNHGSQNFVLITKRIVAFEAQKAGYILQVQWQTLALK